MQKGTTDGHALVREFYNPNKFNLIIERDTKYDQYLFAEKIPLGPRKTTLKSDEFMLMPHGYWVIHTPNGQPYNLVTNFGKLIGTGNKLPSRPY